MGPTSLFTHLKIILLQCFQFSVKISCIQTDPKVSGIPLIPSICFIGYQNQCCANNIGGWSLLYSSLFSFFEVPSSKGLLLGVLEGWLLFFPSPRLLDSTFLDPPFGFFSFCHFSQVSWFLSAKLKVSQPHSFIVLLFGFPEVPAPCSWIVGSQAFWSPFCIIMWLIGTYLFFFFVCLGMPHWTVSIPT